ncbi:methionine ABC transporter permease [uncultured Helcococcus sp.]|uniref:methionine ABC transporter permease n=1 Tax=uncultured Helcococcus sp. TaxID=1072508 RepID=UPI002624E5B1|nr:methionine ABC transporter permease [uncultured Helcococcus sp.]
METIKSYLPNLIKHSDEFIQSLIDTLLMLVISGFFVLIIGLFLGVLITVTKKDNILENKYINRPLDILINIFRSIPFIILLTALLPATRAIMGTMIGVKGAIFPLVIGAIPFFVRQVEQALADVDKGVIEAAESMGLSPIEIIFRVYLKESIGQLIRAITITTISLLGLTSLGGAVGAGGIGAFVIRYGHNRRYYDITYVCVILIILFVTIIQTVGNYLAKKKTH